MEVTRGQNVVYQMPHDWASISQFLEPLVARVDAAQSGLQLLVVTPDAEVAAAVSAAAVRLLDSADTQIIAATSAPRAARLLALRPAQVLTGSASTLLELVRGSAVKLDSVRAVCIAWADELLARGEDASLELLMAEVPKEAARAIVAAALTPPVEALIERYARRARRVVSPVAEAGEGTSVQYVTVASRGRLEALRRVLDDQDPASAIVFTREETSERAVESLLRSLGYSGPAAAVRVARAAAPDTKLVVLFDLPATHGELREAVGSATAFALVQPRQIESLRALAAGGAVRPYTLPEAGRRAKDRESALREELRRVITEQTVEREILALEPLLADYDGVEIAAAALKLLEVERATVRATPPASAAAAPPKTRESGAMTRLFVTVGERDNVRPADLVGAIANQAGLTGASVGKIDIRASHSIVEVASDSAESVIESLNGTTIRGRRVVARRDDENRRPRTSDRPEGKRPPGNRPPGNRPRRDAGSGRGNRR
ncbi:MAG TPA: DbpA RNA binding domain-containing protein [Gemmatimonadaceae bacterium]|nr:DbpA RNA binding domain-containing protein [Gemmatimonadaceae bacterium]